jgi:hypothetical protein
MKVLKKKIDLGDGVVISLESSDEVPDTTTDAGPDTIKLHEDAQKPESDPNAEYDASDNVDVPEDVEKANESSFFGVILNRRSIEAFAKVKGSFPSSEAFFKSNECKAAIAVAKQWGEKKKMSSVSSNEIPDNLKKLGFAVKNVGGVALACREEKGKLYVDVLFKNGKGKVISKKFAVVKIGSAPKKDGKAKGGESKSAVDKVLLSHENDDPVDNAFATTESSDDTEPKKEPKEEPKTEPAAPAAPAEPPAETPAEPPAEKPSEDTDGEEITPEEIEEEAKGEESYLAAVSKIYRSREETDAAVSEISDNDIDEVVGGDEGSDVAEVAAPSEPPPPDTATEDEADKALEAYLQSLEI